MRVTDAVPALQQLKGDPALRAVPLIVLTALGQEKDVVGCLKAGAADFIIRPFNLNELVARIDALLWNR